MESARLTYTALGPGHLDAFHALVLDDHVGRYLLDGQSLTREWSVERIADSQSLFVRRGVGLWLASETRTGAVVGFCGFIVVPAAHPEPQLVYALPERFTGRGYATEMAQASIAVARTKPGFDAVLAGADAANAASVRVLEKLGFERVSATEGTFGEVIHFRLATLEPPPSGNRCTIRALRESDYAPITSRVDEWWGRPVRGGLLRLFFEHFCPMSRVAEQDGEIVGFLVGFRSQTHPEVAYAHYVAVSPAVRGQGLARELYSRFFEDARTRGCTAVEAITSPVNHQSMAFHQRLGFELLPGNGVVNAVPVSLDHDGPGEHRVRMRRLLRATKPPERAP
jgi:RimJ/RimL family protein N-acetyltransferase